MPQSSSHASGRLTALVGVLLLAGGLCLLVVVSNLHRNAGMATGGHRGATSSQTSLSFDLPPPELEVPPQLQSNAQLVAEYKRVAGDLAQLKAHLRRMRARMHDEAHPPDPAGLPGRGLENSGFGSAAGSSSTASESSVELVPPKNPMEEDSIFVSVAAFRDVECAPTVTDLFEQASNPSRIYVGAIEQNEPEDGPEYNCFPKKYLTCSPDKFCPLDNIRMRRVRAKDAKGPTFGRYVAMLMYRGEKYFMMIDSHNRFVPQWDLQLIQMYHQIPSKKAVLSHYPPSYNGGPIHRHSLHHTTVMCNAHYIGTGFLRMDGMLLERSEVPRLQPFSAAGFLFADSLLVQEVPFDPHLDYLFDGEEILYSARMWTSGWDMYAPSQSVLFHFYVRSNAPRVWSIPNNRWWDHQQVSNARVQFLLKSTDANSTALIVTPERVKAEKKFSEKDQERLFGEIEKYGLGKDRTLDDYWKFAETDPKTRTGGKSYCEKARHSGKRA